MCFRQYTATKIIIDVEAIGSCPSVSSGSDDEHAWEEIMPDTHFRFASKIMKVLAEGPLFHRMEEVEFIFNVKI